MAKGKCILCGKEITPKEDGSGDCMAIDIYVHHPLFPSLESSWKGRWAHHTCVKNLACQICDNDASF